ncbi:hypothetical protein [Geodermatophilus marinus]|uniref:hypothetical protein n=1 Tax=Geodermatophilus sp. LHW52908 TaxID=2303986 RepID=UPI0018F509BA|nr:hypothetical protein [Geodermatophilus sp. LHW52908]
MDATEQAPPSPLRRALDAARELGRSDGRLAVEVEPVGEPAGGPAGVGSWCHGLSPDDLARLVWGGGAGAAPAGVRLNAPLWYAHGFREALASARAERGRRRDGTSEVPRAAHR